LSTRKPTQQSPQFRHFLTSQQFNAYFAPTPSQHAYVIAALQAAGFRVVQTFSNRTVVDVAGPSAAAERFFNTEIHLVVQGRYGTRFATVKPATLSADLAPLVRSVSLTNFVVAHTRPIAAAAAARAHTLSSPSGVANWGTATPDWGTNQKCTGAPENGPLTQVDDDGRTGFLATSIAKAFDFPVQHGCNGAGKTAAIVINGVVLQSDVDLYMQASHVKQTGKLVNIPIDGGSTDVSGEGSLDAETIIGLAPAARVNVYVIPDFSDQHVLDAPGREHGWNKPLDAFCGR
jgi:subtilase family serine protease